jgi:hypothetical protein
MDECRLELARRRAKSVLGLKDPGTIARRQLAEDVLWLIEELVRRDERLLWKSLDEEIDPHSLIQV